MIIVHITAHVSARL